MVSAYLTSALLMGTLVVVVVGTVVRSRRWQTYSPETAGPPARTEPGHGSRDGPALFDRTDAWIAGFVLLSLAAIGGVFVFVSNPSVPSSLTSGPIVAVSAILLSLYVLLSVYVTARQRGHSGAIATAETAAVFGALLLAAITVQLMGS